MTTTPIDPQSRNAHVTAPAVARSQVLGAVRTAMRSLAEAPWSAQHADHLLGLLREALEVSERGDDGTKGRAAPAVRAACAHLSARKSEDAYLALQCAEERFGCF